VFCFSGWDYSPRFSFLRTRTLRIVTSTDCLRTQAPWVVRERKICTGTTKRFPQRLHRFMRFFFFKTLINDVFSAPRERFPLSPPQSPPFVSNGSSPGFSPHSPGRLYVNGKPFFRSPRETTYHLRQPSSTDLAVREICLPAQPWPFFFPHHLVVLGHGEPAFFFFLPANFAPLASG